MPRPPKAFAGTTGSDSLDALAYEAAQETATALGRIGSNLETALEALRRHDATQCPNQDRDQLLQEAADAAWILFIQRDHLGLRTDHHLLNTYDIPKDATSRVGVIARKRDKI